MFPSAEGCDGKMNALFLFIFSSAEVCDGEVVAQSIQQFDTRYPIRFCTGKAHVLPERLPDVQSDWQSHDGETSQLR